MEVPDGWRIWLGPEGIIKDSVRVVSEAYDTIGNNIGYCDSYDLLELTNLNVSIGIKSKTFQTPVVDYSVQPAGASPGSRMVFRYTLTSPAYVDLAIYDNKGRLIKSSFLRNNHQGYILSSGITVIQQDIKLPHTSISVALKPTMLSP